MLGVRSPIDAVDNCCIDSIEVDDFIIANSIASGICSPTQRAGNPSVPLLPKSNSSDSLLDFLRDSTVTESSLDPEDNSNLSVDSNNKPGMFDSLDNQKNICERASSMIKKTKGSKKYGVECAQHSVNLTNSSNGANPLLYVQMEEEERCGTVSSTILGSIGPELQGGHRLYRHWNHDIPDDVSLDPDAVLALLTSHPILDEYNALQTEVSKSNSEIKALEQDYSLITEYLERMPNSTSTNPRSASTPITSPTSSAQAAAALWGEVPKTNALYISDQSPTNTTTQLTLKERKALATVRKNRGLHFRIKIGGDSSTSSSPISTSPTTGQNNQPKESFDDVRAAKLAFLSRCGSASRARTVSYVSLIGQAAFFLSRDNGKWYCRGNLPPNLQKRLEKKNSTDKEEVNLNYLAVGPASSQCYYAEWSNGDCWWVNFDEEFHKIMKEFPVHRVAFGAPIPQHKSGNSPPIPIPSWIVLSKDGRSAWRGIPTRLSNILKSRDASLPAPCEVSLGPGGSYFIKFLNGDTDYILPAIVADECEDVERNGGKVTNVGLHVDCYDFIIRHTETSKVKRGEVVIRKSGGGKQQSAGK